MGDTEDPKNDPKSDPKADPKEDPKTDPKADPKEEPKGDPKEEPKEDPKAKGDDDVVLGGKGKEGDDDKAPENYDLKLPEDSPLSKEALEKTAAEARKLGFSNAKAQELLEGKHQAVVDYIDAGNKVAAGWLDVAKKDSVIGGDKFEQACKDGNAAIEKFGDEDFNNLLRTTKFGNHPVVIRFCSRIGKAMRDDNFVPAGGQPGKKATRVADRMFPSSAKKT